MEEILVAFLSMFLIVGLIPLYLWKRRQISSSPDQRREEDQVPRGETVILHSGARWMRRRPAAASTSAAPVATAEEIVEGSDEDVPEDDMVVAKAPKKKEKRRQERDAQRQKHKCVPFEDLAAEFKLRTQDCIKHESPTFSCKFLLVFLSSAAIICRSAFIAFNAVNNKANLYLPSQICDLVQDPTCFQIFLYNSVPRIVDAIEAAHHISRQINDAREQQALADCVELMDLSIVRVKDSAVAIGRATTGSFADAHTWLSSILTNHMSCHDGLMTEPDQLVMEAHLQDLIERASTSLEMFITISPPDEETSDL